MVELKSKMAAAKKSDQEMKIVHDTKQLNNIYYAIIGWNIS